MAAMSGAVAITTTATIIGTTIAITGTATMVITAITATVATATERPAG